MLVEHAERADALREGAGRVGIRAANPPVWRVALAALVTHRGALLLIRLWAIGPDHFARLVVQVLLHDSALAEGVVDLGRVQSASTRPFPLVRITQALAL